MNYIFTALVPFLLLICVLWGNHKTESKDIFMNKDYTRVLKGICSIIVILVHIPLEYSNKLQDGIGSFAYVCVTFFFLISAYGMSLNEEKNDTYLKDFWKNRLSSLLIPCLLVNVGIWSISQIFIDTTLGNIFVINDYVLVLFQYCLWFYIISLGKRYYGNKTANALLIVGVTVSSLLLYFFVHSDVSAQSGWCFERMGLVWGVLLFLYFPRAQHFFSFSIGKVCIFSFLCLLLGILYLIYKPVFFWGEYLLKILLGGMIICWVFIVFSQRVYGNKAIFFLGSISYEIYLSHGGVMCFLSNICPKLSSGVFILLTVIGTIFFSIIIHALDTPIVKFCRKIHLP